MANIQSDTHRAILEQVARQAMLARGLLPDFSPEVFDELNRLPQPRVSGQTPIFDLRHLLWASIDNADSRDLDQLTVAEALPDGMVKILVAIADVDTLVKKNSAIDGHARRNTTSVYTPARIFPMLPERLSNDLSSLNYLEDRLAVVIEMVVWENGTLKGSNIFRALVRNHARLSYHPVAAWLEGKAAHPDSVARVEGLAENLRLQDRVAQELRKYRHECGGLDLETFESCPVFDEDELRALEVDKTNRAKEIIQDFMIAANTAVAKFLERKGYPSFRRVVRAPGRWERIVDLVSDYGFRLPETPDSRALNHFLMRQKATDPLRFPDLSLSIIKLMGRGEYVVELPGEENPDHFGLAIRDYTHSTAPNRRFADLIAQRTLKAALSGSPAPYEAETLRGLASHCTRKEDDADKVERLVSKSAAALLLGSRLGEEFEGIVTGAAQKGTWVRIFHPPAEGRLLEGFEDVDVGQRLSVQLIRTDVKRGFIDFKKVPAKNHGA
jgi:VacB/RNase II family 3'-5' exoribonuclease